ncbi:MAG TPA: hypothetical protein VEL06_02495 [Haliangiales bacterium]|nr:hypothetical protein [Haliangiales bacterium]
MKRDERVLGHDSIRTPGGQANELGGGVPGHDQPDGSSRRSAELQFATVIG